jgi:hypothetical protein
MLQEMRKSRLVVVELHRATCEILNDRALVSSIHNQQPPTNEACAEVFLCLETLHSGVRKMLWNDIMRKYSSNIHHELHTGLGNNNLEQKTRWLLSITVALSSKSGFLPM